jgi:hypothetical protein
MYTGVLVRRPGGKRPLGRPRRGWEDNIKKDIQAVWWEEARTGFIWLRRRTDVGLCERD